jgi:hypothetical protein
MFVQDTGDVGAEEIPHLVGPAKALLTNCVSEERDDPRGEAGTDIRRD